MDQDLKVRKDFSWSKFFRSPEFLSMIVMCIVGFALLYVASILDNKTAKMIVTFLGIGMTFSSTDQLIRLLNEKRYGIRAPKQKNPFKKDDTEC